MGCVPSKALVASGQPGVAATADGSCQPAAAAAADAKGIAGCDGGQTRLQTGAMHSGGSIVASQPSEQPDRGSLAALPLAMLRTQCAAVKCGLSPATSGCSCKGGAGGLNLDSPCRGSGRGSTASDSADEIEQEDWAVAALRDAELGAPIGRWGRSRVYRGTWRDLHVTVKIIDHMVTEGREGGSLQQLEHEAACSRKLEHPHVVQVYHCALRREETVAAGEAHGPTSSGCPSGSDEASGGGGDDDGGGAVCWEGEGWEAPPGELCCWQKLHIQTWIISEYCNRGTLNEAIKRGWLRRRRALDAPPNLHHILRTAHEIASGLRYLHERGVVHGNLDGSGVLLCSTRGTGSRWFTAKVSGGCRLSHQGGSSEGRQALNSGVLTHAAPEVLRHGLHTPAGDVYAFGVLCWEMYNGRLAWQQHKPAQLVRALVVGNAVLPPLTGCPPAFQALVNSCLTSEAADRPAFPAILATLEEMMGRAPAAA